MGIVTPETPDYLPLPSPTSAAKKVVGIGVLGATIALSEHEHTHTETYAAGPPLSHFVTAISSTSTTPFFGSTFDAADVAIQADHQRLYAHTISSPFNASTVAAGRGTYTGVPVLAV
jgi:hypothetical protein